MSEILKCRSPKDLKSGVAPRDLARLGRALKNLTVRVTHRGESGPKYKIEKLTNSANKVEFEDRDGKTMNVARYFQETYNIRLEYINL